MTRNSRRNYPLGGWILIGLGLLMLLGQLFPQNPTLLFVVLALGFIGAAWLTHKIVWLVPGGTFAGLALGIYLVDPLRSTAPDTTQGGLFLLGFAAGWVLMALLSPLVGRFVWWPLIPAVVLALVGWATWGNRLDLLENFNWVWPLVLLGGGVWWLLRPPREGNPKNQS